MLCKYFKKPNSYFLTADFSDEYSVLHENLLPQNIALNIKRVGLTLEEFIELKTLVFKMKKRIITSIFIIALTLSLPLSASQGLSVGDSFTFEVKVASGNFEYIDGVTTVSGETDKFRVGDTAVNKGSQLDVEVTNIGASTVSFDIDQGGVNLASTTSSGLGFALSLIIYTLYPFMVMGISSGSVLAVDPDKGVSLGDIWYIAPPTMDWDSVYDTFNNTDNWAPYFSAYNQSEADMAVTTSATWFDGGETLRFIVSASGNYVIAAESTSLLILHAVEFHYNTTSYVLQGYDIKTAISGDYKGDSTTFSLSAEIAEESYTRRISIEPLALILGIILSSGVLVIIRKRKK